MKPLTQLPYRTPPRDPPEPPAVPERSKGKPFFIAGDRELLPIAIILWLAALAQVIHVVAHGATFGALPTFALVCVFGIPSLFWRSRARRENR